MKSQILIGAACCLSAASAWCQDTNEVQLLKKQLQELQKRIEALEQQQPQTPPSQQPVPSGTNRWSPEQPIQFGSAQNYINISFDALFAAGWSTAEDVESLQTGGHDPKGRGFTVQN